MLTRRPSRGQRHDATPHSDRHYASNEGRFLPSSPFPDQNFQSLCKSGSLDRAVDALSCVHTLIPDATYLCLLKACIKHRLPTHAKRVHAHIAAHRAPGPITGFLGGYLVIALARCGATEDAIQISRTLPSRTVFSWTAIISAYVERGSWHQALHMYNQMNADGVEPDSHTFVSLFKACGELSDLASGKRFHADAQKKGIASATFVGNSIVSMYGKCRALLEAEHVLTSLPEPDVVSWNAMMSVFVEQGLGERALLLYKQMREDSVSPNLLTYVIVLQACTILAEDLLVQSRSGKLVALDIGQAVQADARRSGYTEDMLICTTLISLYKKSGALAKAESIFTTMRQHNAVSWTAMLSAYAEHGHRKRALCLYRQVRVEGFTPNQLTYLFSLQACVTLAEKDIGIDGVSMKSIALKIGRGLHIDACRDNYLVEPSISSTLLSLYGKCGALEEAEGLFDNLSVRNTVSWTAMLSLYVERGQSMIALQLFESLKEVMPVDVVVLLYVLQACSEAGSLLTCEQLHFAMVSAGHDSLPSIVATLIHVYGSCASVADIYSVFYGAKSPNIVEWNACCCAGYSGDVCDLTSLQMFEKLKLAALELDEVTFSAALSICSNLGNVSSGLEIFVSMIQDSGINPDLRHLGSMVDLFVRAGNFRGIENMLERMVVQADYALWFCLLSACRIHGNVELAKRAFDQAVKIMPNCASPYIMLSNIYVEAGLHECATVVENTRQIEGAWEFGPELE